MGALQLLGVSLGFCGNDKKELMVGTIRERLGEYERLRGRSLPNRVFPAPMGTPFVPGVEPAEVQGGGAPVALRAVTRPDNLEEVCFWTLPDLAALLRPGSGTYEFTFVLHQDTGSGAGVGVRRAALLGTYAESAAPMETATRLASTT